MAYMVSNGLAENVEAAISLGDRLIDNNYMHHVVRDHTFKNQIILKFDILSSTFDVLVDERK